MSLPERSIKKHLIQSVDIYRPVIILAVATTIVSLAIFMGAVYNSGVVKALELSPSTAPWGLVTAVFVHQEWQHIAANLAMLWVWTLYILLPHSFVSEHQRKRRAKFFIAAMLGSAIVANIAWMTALTSIRPGTDFSSIGASGLVYAFCGAALGFAILNMTDAIGRLNDLTIKRKKVIFVIMSNAIVVSFIVGMVLYSPDVFLSKAPGSNVFAHAVGFMLGMALVMGQEYIMKWKGRPNTALPIKG